MTIQYLAGLHIEGTSADTKPDSVPSGSIFTETDTLTQYLFDGASWNQLSAGSLGDLEFLQQRADEGNLVSITATRNTTGEICAITPPNGKTFHLVKAAITGIAGIGGAAQVCKVEVRNDGTAKDIMGSVDPTAPSGPPRNESIIVGDILIGNGTKKYSLEMTSNTDAKDVVGTILGYYTVT